MVCHGMVLENPWDMLTNMLTVDTTTALGQVNMSFCIHTLFIYEAGNSPKVHLLLTDKLTVDTLKALGPVDIYLYFVSLFIYEANWELVQLLHTDKLTVDTSTCHIGTIVCVFLSNWEQYKGGPSAYK